MVLPHVGGMGQWKKITRVAELQHMVLAPWQCRAAGISPKALRNHIEHHGWVRGEFGMIWLPGPSSPLRRLAAALLTYSAPRSGAERARLLEGAGVDAASALARAALGAGQTVSGRSAAWLHGLVEAPATISLRLPGRTGHTKRPGVQLRYGRPASIEWFHGLPAAGIEQTIVDIAAVATGSMRVAHFELARLVALAHAKRLTTPERIQDWLARAGAVDGALLLGGVLAELRGEMVHSETERRARVLANEVLARYGLSLHSEPYCVTLGGRRIAEADLAVLALRLDVEIDGPHHHLPAQVVADQNRDRLMRQAGWTVERFSVEDLDLRPHVFKRALDTIVRHLLAAHADRTVLSERT